MSCLVKRTACWKAVSAVMKTVGTVAAAWKVKLAGMGTTVCHVVLTWDPKHPTACPTTARPVTDQSQHIGTVTRLSTIWDMLCSVQMVYTATVELSHGCVIAGCQLTKTLDVWYTRKPMLLYM